MHDLAIVWDVGCTRCDAALGQVVDGRFVHDATCTLPRRIDGGRLKCCACGGPVVPRERRDSRPGVNVPPTQFRAKAR
jgi:hypothetical protein